MSQPRTLEQTGRQGVRLPRLVSPFVLLLPLAGCGGSLAGTYKCEDSGPVDTIELKSDGALVATSSMFGDEQQRTGTWQKNGDGLIATIGGHSTPLGIDGSNLTLMGGRCIRQ